MSIDKTLAERGERYGKFADHAVIAQGIQDVMRAAANWRHLDQDMKQALSVIADKIARILNGDPYYVDNWHDIIGYSKLIEDRLNMIPTPDNTLYDPNSTIPSDEWNENDPRLNGPVAYGGYEDATFEPLAPAVDNFYRQSSPITSGGPGFNGSQKDPLTL